MSDARTRRCMRASFIIYACQRRFDHALRVETSPRIQSWSNPVSEYCHTVKLRHPFGMVPAEDEYRATHSGVWDTVELAAVPTHLFHHEAEV